MKKTFAALFLTAALGVAHAQYVPIGSSGFVVVGTTPSGSCAPGQAGQFVWPTGLPYTCPSSTSIWTQVGVGGGGSGTVTSVTGTANQIDVATGTTTPVLSLSSTLALPTGTAISTPISGVITNLTGTCTACTANAVTTIPPLSAINAQTATYQVLAADFSAYKVIPVASGTFTVTLVASGSQPAAGQYIEVINFGTGFVTVARSGQNINGGTTSIVLPPSTSAGPSSAKIWSDGTNYFAHTVGATGNGYLTGSAAPAFTAATAGLAGMFTNTANADIYSQGPSGATIGGVRLIGLTGSNGGATSLATFSSTLDTLFAPLINGSTKFTTSGCSVSSTTGNGTAGIFTLGANSCTVIITLNGATGFTATNGWICEAHDRTATTIFLGGEASSTTTTCSIAIPVTAGATDVIAFTARPY